MHDQPTLPELRALWQGHNLQSALNEAQRHQNYYLQAAGLLLDYSRHYLSAQLWQQLSTSPAAERAFQRLQAQCNGEIVNGSEAQAATHSCLRGTPDSGGVDAVVSNNYMLELARQIASAELSNHAGVAYSDYVHIGIGGSYLGPRLLCEAIAPSSSPIRVHFLANVDPQELAQLLPKLNLERTLWGVASKSFSTLETQANFAAIRSLLRARNLPELHNALAITARPDRAQALGFEAKQILHIPNTVGGRFSLWSAMALPFVLHSGPAAFQQLLAGAHALDAHALSSPTSMPMILALLDYYYMRAHSVSCQALLVYSNRLRSFSDYYQQLSMESLGKSVDSNNQPLPHPGGMVIFGGEGTNGQHAYHQLLHQGGRLIPCEFVVCARSPEQEFASRDMHRQLLANAIAQAEALALGANSEHSYARVPGNKPSSIICLPELNPYSLGALLALYEHRTALLGYLLDINPFDQWGVELGKRLAAEIYPEFSADNPRNLIAWLLQQGA